MFERTWTEEEEKMFEDGLTDSEIVVRTGRSASSVFSKRRRMRGSTKRDVDYVKIPPCRDMTEKEKLERIKKLSEKYGVKLLCKKSDV